MKDIPGYEGLYAVTETGQVISLRSGLPMRAKATTGWYIQVRLCKNGIQTPFRVHRLVAQSFIPNPENKKTVNHKNGIKTDNRVENLEWCTHSENSQHSFRILKRKPVTGLNHPKYRPIIDLQTGIFYSSTFEAAYSKGLNRNSVKASLRNGTTKFGFAWA